jgi:hypothetical protein
MGSCKWFALLWVGVEDGFVWGFCPQSSEPIGLLDGAAVLACPPGPIIDGSRVGMRWAFYLEI